MRALLLILLAGPAVAQGWEPVTEVQADLDRDGTVETYRIVDGGEGMVDLLVDEGGRERVVPAVAWTGGVDGQRPELSLSEAGSVVLTSMNEAIGRDRWRLSLTVAHREGDWRIAGVTYDWWDTLEPETGWGRCDLNLLSGRGEVAGPAGESALDLATPAMALWDWREAMVPEVLPAACFG
jgi:hypothetical protein